MTSGGGLVTHTVLMHRLALGVETVDAVTGRAAGTTVRVGREAPDQPRRRRRGQDLDPMLRRADLPLEASGTGRYRLRHELRRSPVPRPGDGVPRAPAPVVVRIDDPWRRFVPRRLSVPLWTLAEVEAAEAAGGHIPVRSRLLRPWLLPGSAYVLPGGATGLRGRVRDAAGPLPWPRIEARIEVERAGEMTVGRAHGDERGEFLLVVTTLGDDDWSLPSEIALRIIVFGPAPVPPPTPPPASESDDEDRLAGLPAEPVPRTAATPPPDEADLDTALMRGETLPPGYRQSSTGRSVTVPVGGMRSEPTPFLFSP